MARPREFDPEVVLNAARDLFWHRGYKAASLDELARITGVKKPSLYAAFGDKSQLFLAVLDRYHNMLLGVASHMLGQDASGCKAVRTWLTAFAPFCSEVRGEHGCLSVNTSLEASELVPEVRTAIDTFQHAIQALLQAALDRARSQGELPADFDSKLVARLLFVAQSGFMVMAASRPPAADTLAAMERLLDALLPAPIHSPTSP